MNSADARLFAMLVGWILAFYGVYRRDWMGTVTAMSGLSVSAAAMTIEDREQIPAYRRQDGP